MQKPNSIGIPQLFLPQVAMDSAGTTPVVASALATLGRKS